LNGLTQFRASPYDSLFEPARSEGLRKIHHVFSYSKEDRLKNSKLIIWAACLLLAMAVACGKKEEAPSTSEAPAAGGGAGAATPFDPASGTATVGGKVTFQGTAPPQAQIKLNADPVCVSLHKEPVYAEEVVRSEERRVGKECGRRGWGE